MDKERKDPLWLFWRLQGSFLDAEKSIEEKCGILHFC